MDESERLHLRSQVLGFQPEAGSSTLKHASRRKRNPYLDLSVEF